MPTGRPASGDGSRRRWCRGAGKQGAAGAEGIDRVGVVGPWNPGPPAPPVPYRHLVTGRAAVVGGVVVPGAGEWWRGTALGGFGVGLFGPAVAGGGTAWVGSRRRHVDLRDPSDPGSHDDVSDGRIVRLMGSESAKSLRAPLPARAQKGEGTRGFHSGLFFRWSGAGIGGRRSRG